MLYCTFSRYQAQGGSMDGVEWAIWGPRASRVIDRLTYGRAKLYTVELADELADACAQIAELLLQRQKIYANSLGLASATNDGISETYITGEAASSSVEAAARQILQEALGDDPFGLLYAGVRGC